MLIEADLQQQHIDVESGILRQRSWRWLKVRILGLLATPDSRISRALAASQRPGGPPVEGVFD